MTHRHAFVPIDGTLFAASYAQPGVLVCLEDGVQRLGIDRERLARAMANCGLNLMRGDTMALVLLHDGVPEIADRYEADDE